MSLRADGDLVFLRDDVKLEPLKYRWYAWPHLIAPAQHAMNIAFRYLPMMRSFVSSPAVHAAAVADRKTLGAPFIDVGEGSPGDVAALLHETTAKAAAFVDFALCWRDFNSRLQQGAKGYSLDGEYRNVPEALAGLVELVYDTNNHPRVRLLEELIYDRPGLDDTQGQQLRVSDVPDAQRAFFLTAPRLRGQDALDLDIPFADPAVDFLASLRSKPAPRAEIAARLSLDGERARLLHRYLTDQPPVRIDPEFHGEGVRVRYFGHACVLIQSAGTAVLVDPLTAWGRAPGEFSLAFADLPDNIDSVVFSHCHMDHFCPEMILQLRSRVGTWVVPRNNPGELADPSMKLILRRLGCRNVVSLDTLESVAVGAATISSLPFPGEHCGLDIASKQALALAMKGRSFLFLVDSDAVDPALYQKNGCFGGRYDAVFVGMECHGAPLSWFYGPLLGKTMPRRDDESRRGNASNCERARLALGNVDCRKVYVYAMGNESWNRYLLGLEYDAGSIQIVEAVKFVSACIESGIDAERLTQCREMHF